MGKLITTVHVYDDDGTAHVFGPGDKVPKKYRAQITAPGVFDDDEESGEDTQPPAPTEPPGAPPAGGLEKPPVAGAGSSTEAWLAYAQSLELDVADDAKKTDLIEAVKQHEEQGAS